MRSINRIVARFYVVAMALCAIASSAIRAQAPGAPHGIDTVALDCQRDFEVPGAYEKCALHIDANKLQRGSRLDVVSVRHVLRPLKIADFVAGDSALRYARKYHRAEMWRTGLVALGAVTVAGSLASRKFCKKESRVCLSESSSWFSRGSSLYLGAGFLAASIPFRVSAYRSSHKAIDFFNASLGK